MKSLLNSKNNICHVNWKYKQLWYLNYEEKYIENAPGNIV